MSWYFNDLKENVIRAVTPRVASTSQRKLYEKLGYPRIPEFMASEMARAGVPVHGVIREPFERVVSAYRRHKPGFVPDKFEEYVKKRYTWDHHVMPQTVIHTRDGVPVTDWFLFQELVSQKIFPHHNATPIDHINQHDVSMSPEFIDWFETTYVDDYIIYHSLLQELPDHVWTVEERT